MAPLTGERGPAAAAIGGRDPAGGIALVAINAKKGYLPLATAYLHASLLRESLPPAKIFNFDLTTPPDRMLEQLAQANPGILAFSCYVWNIGYVRYLAQRYRRLRPNSWILLGGPEVSPRAEQVLETIPEADIVFIGEGESAFPEVVGTLLKQDRPLEQIQGLAIRRDGIFQTKRRDRIQPMDSLPDPFNSWPFMHEDGQVLPVETMRGCRYPCRFCYYQKGSSGLRFHSMERVFKDLDFALQVHGAKKIYLMDPSFGADRARAMAICHRVQERNIHGKILHAEVRAEEVDLEFAHALRSAGVDTVEVGLQSTTREVLKLAGRPTRMETLRRGLSALKDAGISVELQLIAGLPGETMATFLNSLDEARAMAPETLSCFRLMVLPGTYFWAHSDSMRIVHEGGPPWRVMRTKTMGFDEINAAVRTGILASVAHSSYRLSLKYILSEARASLSQIARDWVRSPEGSLVEEGVTQEKMAEIRSRLLPDLLERTCKERGLGWEFYSRIVEKEKGSS